MKSHERTEEVFGSSAPQQVRRRASFPVCVPSWLPEGVRVVGGNAFGDEGAIVVFRREPGDPSSGAGWVQQTRGTRQGGYAVMADSAQPVAVRGRPATLARGAWSHEGRWVPDPETGLLSWEENGMTYVLSFTHMRLSNEEVVRIAESCAPAR